MKAVMMAHIGSGRWHALVINAEAAGNFSPAGYCPAYKVREDLAAAVVQKQRRDEFETTRLVIRGIATAAVTTGGAGGMHPTFRAGLKSNGGPGSAIPTASGTMPAGCEAANEGC